ncbi:MAG: hypothetical protein AAF429_00135 [Pseudomonadota bacterium]
MKTLLACLTLFLSAQVAQALSCLPYNILRDFNDKADQAEAYVIYLASYRSKGFVLDPNTENDGPLIGIEFTVAVDLEGRALNKHGFAAPERFDATIRMTCAAHWCGGYADVTTPELMFLRKTDAGYVREVGPCDGYTANPPVEEMVPILQKCLRRGACSERNIKRFDRFR